MLRKPKKVKKKFGGNNINSPPLPCGSGVSITDTLCLYMTFSIPLVNNPANG